MTAIIIQGNSLYIPLTSNSVQCCVTSPPYFGLRDYGIDGQIGLENTPEAYVAKMVDVFREVWRVLKDDGTLWLNLGDSYAGSGQAWCKEDSSSIKRNWIDDYGKKKPHGYISSKQQNGIKPKDLFGIPWMVAFALRSDGWYLRQDIIWAKPNPMPESVTDRCTKSHEYIFLLTKSARYYYDVDAINEPSVDLERSMNRYKSEFGGAKVDARIGQGLITTPKGKREFTGYRNKRDVWTVSTQSYPEAHFATFPPKLIEPCILAGSKTGDIILDPFNGSGTTGFVSIKHNRNYVGIELNKKYIELSYKRINGTQRMLI